MAIDIAALLQPLSESAPCGEDMSFSEVYDRIREERRADDPSLSQGEWKTELKTANWRNVLDLSSQVLSNQSKDLQAAVWLGEALIARHGFAGAADACDLLDGLLEHFWDGLYPLADGDDLDERASRLARFDQYASQALRMVRLNTAEPAMNLGHWQSSREIDNLARMNQEAWQSAIDEGKLDGETFDQAISNSGRDFIGATLAAVEVAQLAYQRLGARVQSCFARQAPSIDEIGQVLEQTHSIMTRAAQTLGLSITPGSPAIAETSEDPAPSATQAPSQHPAAAPSRSFAAPPPATKQDALRQLKEIAEYFRRSEPHSPVAFLLERAVSWADMPLDQWLGEVIDDDGMLGRIKEMIGVQRS